MKKETIQELADFFRDLRKKNGGTVEEKDFFYFVELRGTDETITALRALKRYYESNADKIQAGTYDKAEYDRLVKASHIPWVPKREMNAIAVTGLIVLIGAIILTLWFFVPEIPILIGVAGLMTTVLGGGALIGRAMALLFLWQPAAETSFFKEIRPRENTESIELTKTVEAKGLVGESEKTTQKTPFEGLFQAGEKQPDQQAEIAAISEETPASKRQPAPPQNVIEHQPLPQEFEEPIEGPSIKR